MSKKIVANRSGNVLGVWFEKGEPIPYQHSQVARLMSPYSDQLVFESRAKSNTKPPSKTDDK